MTLQTNINYKWEDIRALIEYLAAKHLPNLDTLTVIYNDKLLDKLSSSDIELLGLTSKTGVPHCYTIYLREGTSIPTIICHELIHVDQMERGDLDYDLAKNEYYWQGILWDNPYVAYDKRPWEQEAFGNERKWYKEYKKSKK